MFCCHETKCEFPLTYLNLSLSFEKNGEQSGARKKYLMGRGNGIAEKEAGVGRMKRKLQKKRNDGKVIKILSLNQFTSTNSQGVMW